MVIPFRAAAFVFVQITTTTLEILHLSPCFSPVVPAVLTKSDWETLCVSEITNINLKEINKN